MDLENEKDKLIASLEHLYERNGLVEGFSAIMDRLNAGAVSSVFIAKRPTSELPPKLRTVPIAKMVNGEEIILLSPSLPLWVKKTHKEDEVDAAAVVSGVTRLLEIDHALSD